MKMFNIIQISLSFSFNSNKALLFGALLAFIFIPESKERKKYSKKYKLTTKEIPEEAVSEQSLVCVHAIACAFMINGSIF